MSSNRATNPHKGRTGLDRVLHATSYSLHGLQLAYRGALQDEHAVVIKTLVREAPCPVMIVRAKGC